MQNKVRVHITGVKVNAPTYTNVSFTPSMINFFYGKNGTGKSTLAKAFKDGHAALTWNGDPFPENQILTYNEDFIIKNVQSYGNIPGVFTISEVNAIKKKEADERAAEKKAVDTDVHSKESEIHAKEDEMKDRYTKYVEDVWGLSSMFRDKYPLSLAYLRDKKKFVNKVESVNWKDRDEYLTLEEISALYDTVHGEEQTTYSMYQAIPTMKLPDSPLLTKPIISRSDTDFAKFIRALGNLDWITAGHTKYRHSGNKCPYCQQTMPVTFEEDLSACYDEQYKTELHQLNDFIRSYKNALNSIYGVAKANEQNPFPTPLKTEYSLTFDLFMEKARDNVALLEKKSENPSIEIQLEDLSPLLVELTEVASKINEEIQKRNTVLADIPKQKQRCSDQLWNTIAQLSANIVDTYRLHVTSFETALESLNAKINELKEKSAILSQEIIKLNSETVNTTKAMEDINQSIRSAGFNGFRLREKPGAKYVYQLVRDMNGKEEVVDKDLSEGERHFIAFLYFYHTVMGSQSDEGRIEDKIVIIDDPVSSMDSGSLFVVASLVREMIAVCYNNYELNEENTDDHIRQFFCMTHNPYFFREITYNRLPDYECASFFEIRKDKNNQTSIIECDEDNKLTGGGKINRSPVRNTYDSLWHEYMNTNDPETLMIVIRQILEYYFIQMVGYGNGNLRKDLFDKNEAVFIKRNEDGSENKDDYVTATAMIAMINVGATGFNDGLYYDSSAADITHLRSVFERIFRIMHQEQHYDMMTRRAK